jgi:hypothetical protein
MRSTPLPLLSLAIPAFLLASSVASPARGDDTGTATYSAALQSGLQALRENADSVGLEHLAETAALAASTEILAVRASPETGPSAPRAGGLLTPAR